MSVKVPAFRSIITQPLAVHKFLVDIPGFGENAIVVQATALPGEQLRDQILYIQGEPVYYPTTAQTSHLWPFSVPENENGDISAFFERKKSAIWNQKAGTISPPTWEAIKIYARDLQDNPVLACILHGCWIQGRQDVQLSQQDPTVNWMWQWAFRFQWIENAENLKG